MAQYLILIYEDEKAYGDPSPELWQQAMEAHGRFSKQVVEKGGKILGGEALEPTPTATSIRGDVVTDGRAPGAEPVGADVARALLADTACRAGHQRDLVRQRHVVLLSIRFVECY